MVHRHAKFHRGVHPLAGFTIDLRAAQRTRLILRRPVLLNDGDRVVDSRRWRDAESFEEGVMVQFLCHLSRIRCGARELDLKAMTNM